MDKSKKTEDIKKYQAEYRKAHPRDKATTNEYMKSYIKNAEDIGCGICGGHYKSYAKYRHDATQKHIKALAEIEIKNREAEAEAAAAEAAAEAAAAVAAAAVTPKKPRKKRVAREKSQSPPPKPASLKALEEYESSSDEEEEKSLEKETFILRGKRIDSDAVAEYIKAHFEASVSPARAADTKTKRQNKDASLWKKVSEALNGKTFKYLGQHFGEIVAGAYDKPTSQADLISLLKRVAVHFSKVPAAVEKSINTLARKLKESHVKKTT